MDENLLLLDFRLLVDRTTEILGKLSTSDRVEAINYGLVKIRTKFPELYQHLRRECLGNESQAQRATCVVKQENEDDPMWRDGQKSERASEVHRKADLNQNFERIMCKEEVKFDDDELNGSVLACGSGTTRLNNSSDEYSVNVKTNLTGRSFPVATNGTALYPARTVSGPLSSFVTSLSYGNTSRWRMLSKELQNLLTGHFPTNLPWKIDLRKFRFYTHDFFTQFRRRDEDFNRNAFRQQILAALEFAVNHRKPFLRNFVIQLLLSGAIIPGVKLPPRLIERNSERETSSSIVALFTAADAASLSSSYNGVVKEFMDLEESSVTEETTQNTDSSEEATRAGAESPLNSIEEDRSRKDKENNVSLQNAAKAKEKTTYQCALCPKSYRKRKALIDHYKLHPGHCHDCGKLNGSTLEEIIEHNRSYHADEFPFICEHCGESYTRRQQFHAHVESHNKKDGKHYSCDECGMEFSRKKLHRQHIDESGHKPDGAICEVCGEGFNSKVALCQHMNSVHKKDNSFECHICHNRFAMKASLERHVQLHTEIKRTYVCDQCGSSYFTYPALREHFSNAHTDVSECKCTLCGKTFSSVKSLQRHLPSHSEERPHTCIICSQSFKWKTHLVRHKQAVHGNQQAPKKLKRFAKCDEDSVPVDNPPPPAKIPRKSNSKPKASTSSSAATKSSSGASTKSKTSTPSTTPTTPQLESQNNFTFPAAENHLNTSNINATSKNNHLIDINSFNAGAAENYRFDPTVNFTSTQQITIKSEPQPHMMPYDGRFQQGSPLSQQQQQQQQQQIHPQSAQHLHSTQSHIQQAHHQPPQVLHHHPPQQQQQHLHQHQQAQQLHPAAHHHHHPHHQQQQHISNQIIHSQQQSLHQSPQSRMQSPRRHLQSPQGLMQSPQHHMQSPQPHLQQAPQPHMRHSHTPQPHHHQQQHPPAHLQHPQAHLQQQQSPHLQQQPQPSHLPPQHSTTSHQSQQNHHPQQMQYAPEWHNINYNAATAAPTMNSNVNAPMDSSKAKYFPVIELNSTDFMGLPMAEMPKNNQQQPMDTDDLLGFQNMWPGNNPQLNFNNGNIEPNTYSNIGSILTNLELIGNNAPMDFNNYDIMSEHQMGTQQLQHHTYIQDLDPNSGNMNHPVINYDYSSQPNHTITELSNTIQDQKNDFQYNPSSNYEHSVATAGSAAGGRVYNQNENDKVILPPISDYMHQATMQQQQQQQYE